MGPLARFIVETLLTGRPVPLRLDPLILKELLWSKLKVESADVVLAPSSYRLDVDSYLLPPVDPNLATFLTRGMLLPDVEAWEAVLRVESDLRIPFFASDPPSLWNILECSPLAAYVLLVGVLSAKLVDLRLELKPNLLFLPSLKALDKGSSFVFALSLDSSAKLIDLLLKPNPNLLFLTPFVTSLDA